MKVVINNQEEDKMRGLTLHDKTKEYKQKVQNQLEYQFEIDIKEGKVYVKEFTKDNNQEVENKYNMGSKDKLLKRKSSLFVAGLQLKIRKDELYLIIDIPNTVAKEVYLGKIDEFDGLNQEKSNQHESTGHFTERKNTKQHEKKQNSLSSQDDASKQDKKKKDKDSEIIFRKR
ncbi:MAG: hypothetical protein ABEJ24_04545 [Candidatus Magasanikbacteria bacterium]